MQIFSSVWFDTDHFFVSTKIFNSTDYAFRAQENMTNKSVMIEHPRRLTRISNA